MKNSKLCSCITRFGLFCHAKCLVNSCWSRTQKVTMKLENVLLWRCLKHDTLFKTFLRDIPTYPWHHIFVIHDNFAFFSKIWHFSLQSFSHMTLCMFSYYKSLEKSVSRKTEISQEQNMWKKMKIFFYRITSEVEFQVWPTLLDQERTIYLEIQKITRNVFVFEDEDK